VFEQNGEIVGRSSVKGRQRRLWLASVLASVLLLLLLFPAGPAFALNWRLPGRATPAPLRQGPEPSSQRLQEVPPPEWVQRLDGVLDQRDPQVRILAPVAESVLPEGPWTLRLQVADWPLVDAGPLGLGPHLVVQLDGEPPRPVVATEVEMPPLSPGSHLLTVYAAKPWGEAHKSPSALQQIRVHRLAPNPATLPAAGSPQLIPVSPVGSAVPPLLLDWLLMDAPLQGLRTDSLGWRLRVTLNGESVLLDRQTPLWLKGWRSGSNALLLELLDGRGELLNPPFNSRLQEVIVPGAGGLTPPHSPAYSPLELAVLLGDQPLSALEPPPPPAPSPAPSPTPAPVADARSAAAPVQERPAEEMAPVQQPVQQPAQDPVLQEKPVAQEDPDAPQEPVGQEQLVPPVVDPLPSAPVPTAEPEPETEPESPPAPPSPPIVSAREEVNPDGTLKRAAPPGPLQRLRERLQR
jgi:hypothetical protein